MSRIAPDAWPLGLPDIPDQAVQAIKRFEAANPRAKVVRIPNALHQVFTSNPDAVAREMSPFIEGLN